MVKHMLLLDKVKEGKGFNLGGYAGTGKTTQIREVYDKYGTSGNYCSPTHAAAHVMSGLGVPATTMHRLIYTYDEEQDRFYKRRRLDGDFILCDEASMLNSYQIRDLKSFGVPVYLVGDPFQLGPVKGFMAFEPDETLTKVHRHGGAVLRRATLAREEGEWEGDELDWDYVYSADMVICGYNKTRHQLNDRIRKHQGMSGKLCIGDRIIIRNNTKHGFNGQLLTVKKLSIEGDQYRVNGKPCIFADRSGDFKSKHICDIDYAYARTCHSAQGSQADRVAIFCEPVGMADNWVYTALTRAIKEVKLYEV